MFFLIIFINIVIVIIVFDIVVMNFSSLWLELEWNSETLLLWWWWWWLWWWWWITFELDSVKITLGFLCCIGLIKIFFVGASWISSNKFSFVFIKIFSWYSLLKFSGSLWKKLFLYLPSWHDYKQWNHKRILVSRKIINKNLDVNKNRR